MVNDTEIVSKILITWHIMVLNTLGLPFAIPLAAATPYASPQMQRFQTLHFAEERNCPPLINYCTSFHIWSNPCLVHPAIQDLDLLL